MARGNNKKGFSKSRKTPKYQKNGYKQQITELQTQNKALSSQLAKTSDPSKQKVIRTQIKNNNAQIRKFLKADIKTFSKQLKRESSIANASENTKRTKAALYSTALSTTPSGVADIIDSTNTATVASGRDDSSAEKDSSENKLTYEDLINSLGGKFD